MFSFYSMKTLTDVLHRNGANLYPERSFRYSLKSKFKRLFLYEFENFAFYGFLKDCNFSSACNIHIVESLSSIGNISSHISSVQANFCALTSLLATILDNPAKLNGVYKNNSFPSALVYYDNSKFALRRGLSSTL